MQKLTYLVDYDGGTFYLSNIENDHRLTSPIVYNVDSHFGKKYLQVYNQLDYSKALMYTGRSVTYRESDIIDEGKRILTPYYQMFYRSYHFHYSLHSSISYKNHFLGVMSLFRNEQKENFSQDDIELIELLTTHLENSLYHYFLMEFYSQKKITVSQAVKKFRLTNRQTIILKSLLDGLENNQICENLCITNNTLKKHISNIYKKLNISNRVQLFKMINEKEK
ncbi:helix-turn-helix transcriptional regulator [Liquorilactobacillus sicerae]|uniref:helix-turn-helix transcriptional regulator n=1 Tax=Liquorilactobacillus sicerae TaxID=1416943 RepID=UPI002480889A|nr:LuxR C-terminal-related transcriptional regulator [Liquorilactobacillus sicerae]